MTPTPEHIEYRAPFDGNLMPMLQAFQCYNDRPILGFATGTVRLCGSQTARNNPHISLYVDVLDIPWPLAEPHRFTNGTPIHEPADFDAITPGGTTLWIRVDAPDKDSWRDRPPLL